jgi:hypothetical protein
VAEIAGSRDSLSSEKRYVLRSLPNGVRHGITDAFWRGEGGGLGRAGAIIGGLILTALGYAQGRLMLSLKKQRVSTTDNDPLEDLV